MESLSGHVDAIPDYVVLKKPKNFTDHVDNIPEYAVINKPVKNTMLIVEVSKGYCCAMCALLCALQNPMLYETAECWREDLHTSPEPIPYITPETTISRDKPKLVCNDYHTLQNPAEYSTALHIYSNTLRDPNTFSDIYDDTRTKSYSNTLKEDGEEEIFLDPGHSEEAIYACFERKMFRTIKTDHVRSVQLKRNMIQCTIGSRVNFTCRFISFVV